MLSNAYYHYLSLFDVRLCAYMQSKQLFASSGVFFLLALSLSFFSVFIYHEREESYCSLTNVQFS